uniref:Uncharacterized protein n=1 Tax=Caenorhabditis japonica TaxID=281687 RepID=A0A8R1IJL1_CAEJA
MRRIRDKIRYGPKSQKSPPSSEHRQTPHWSHVQKIDALTDQTKAARIQRCRELLKRFKPVDTLDIVFTNEKLFTFYQSDLERKACATPNKTLDSLSKI